MRQVLREAFDLGVKVGRSGMGAEIPAELTGNVISIATLRERRAQAQADAKAELFELPGS